MNDINRDKVARIGIIGGGKVGLQLMWLFSNSTLSQVVFVVDLDQSAPAMVAAKKIQIPVFTNMDHALETNPPDFVLEVTGSKKVIELLRQKLQNSSIQIIDHEVAYILIRVIEENNDLIKKEVIADISTIHENISKSVVKSDNLLEEIQTMTSNLRLLSLNARIEAARIGEAGKGFAVVAQEMRQFSETVKNLTDEMEQLNQNVRTIADSIEASLAKLDQNEIG